MMIFAHRRARGLAIATLTAALALGVAAAPAAQAASPGHAKRVIASNFADPGFAHFGSYYYLYSTGTWSAATSTSAFREVRTVMSTSSTGLCGPGGATVISDGKTTRIAFHSWKNGTASSKVRVAWVDVLKWTSAGSPYRY